MQQALIVLGTAVLALALRSCRAALLRKSGAFMLLVATFLAFYFGFGHWAAGLLGVSLWFCLPWIELLTRVRALRLPMDNRLISRETPRESLFPHATEALHAMEEADFEHVEDSGWSWAGMDQFFKIHWNPEEQAVATVCLCEQENVAFAFVTITSHGKEGQVWRTTNFPFSPTLKSLDSIHWNHVPCEQSCFRAILNEHKHYLAKQSVPLDELYIPNPDMIVREIQDEMKAHIEHNLAQGIIEEAGSHKFRYTTRGLFFLWRQLVRDMIRLC